MLFQKSLTVCQPRFWTEIAIIVMILLIWSDIGSVVATYLTVYWSHLKGSRQTERHNTMTYHDSFWPVMQVMLVMAMVSMVSMIGPKCLSGFSEHHPMQFCTEVTSHKVVQNLHQRSSIVVILKSVPTFRDLRSCARWPWH